MNLLELTNEADALKRLIDEHAENNDGDLTTVIQSIEALESEIGDAITNKLGSIIRVIREYEITEDALRCEAKRLTDRARVAQNKSERLKQYAKMCMDNAGLQKVDAVIGTIYIRKNSKLVIDNATLLPESCFATKLEPKRELVKLVFETLPEGAAHYEDSITIR